MIELRIRVKPAVKELLETIKEKNGFSINFQVNFAIFKYLALDTKVPLWKLDSRPDPHYETINKMPDEVNELPFGEKGMVKKRIGDDCCVDKPEPIRLSNNEKVLYVKEGMPSIHSKSRGDKC